MVSSKIYTLAHPPNKGEVTADTFKLETVDLPELKDGELLVKIIALSNDPAQRTWMDSNIDPARHYLPPIEVGEMIRADGIVEVVESKSTKWSRGQRVVYGNSGWREYAIVKDSDIKEEAANIEGQSKWLSLSGCGMVGRTAYMGAYKEMNLKPEHTLLISGAAGAVGSILVQIAKKVIGCKRVVGIAGGKSKCDHVVELGADACVDYKEEGWQRELKEVLQGEADCFFDNVGGEILDEALTLVKRFGFISICGAISGYNGKPLELTQWREVIYNRITIKGFINFDHMDVMAQAGKDLAQWVKEGKINVDQETAVDTKFEDIPKTWNRLFTGENIGKLITVLK